MSGIKTESETRTAGMYGSLHVLRHGSLFRKGPGFSDIKARPVRTNPGLAQQVKATPASTQSSKASSEVQRISGAQATRAAGASLRISVRVKAPRDASGEFEDRLVLDLSLRGRMERRHLLARMEPRL